MTPHWRLGASDEGIFDGQPLTLTQEAGVSPKIGGLIYIELANRVGKTEIATAEAGNLGVPGSHQILGKALKRRLRPEKTRRIVRI
ncbi:MAG: hypothetical protein EA395_14395 [Phormidium sp. GEM2.Bin31]|nr:MAG: hypothetical protein EA395_14395 [Phormidium sp. GEM2.Bin31]